MVVSWLSVVIGEDYHKTVLKLVVLLSFCGLQLSFGGGSIISQIPLLSQMGLNKKIDWLINWISVVYFKRLFKISIQTHQRLVFISKKESFPLNFMWQSHCIHTIMTISLYLWQNNYKLWYWSFYSPWVAKITSMVCLVSQVCQHAP